MDNFGILKELLLTEKSNFLSANLNKYTFKVCSHATKQVIAKAVESLFKVTVISVNILNTSSKLKRARVCGARLGQVQSFKKAIISLKKDDKIEVI